MYKNSNFVKILKKIKWQKSLRWITEKKEQELL